MNKSIIPIFIPHVGCPHDCSFCNQKRIAGERREVSGKELSETIDTYLSTITNDKASIEVAFYGGSFTGLPLDNQRELLMPAYRAKEAGKIDDIRLSTRPDYINDKVLSEIYKLGVSTIELGVQSTNDEVLIKNLRGHSSQDVEMAVNLIKAYNIQLGLQMMIGLLGDTPETIAETVKDFIKWRPNFVRIYPTIVIKDTHLEELYNLGIYKPMDLEEVISIGKDALLAFNTANIPVIRMGLQSTEEITYGVGIVAGPYHPAYRELVETEIFRDKIQREFDKEDIKNSQEIVIYCNKRDPSKVAGYKKSNKDYFTHKYKLKSLKIKITDQLMEGELVVKNDSDN
ncbi:elongator complex protein 3 [Alkaliphilus serpentinus]|nr:radical SAM protein [Alkaliphilus serpentinus]